MQVKNFIKPLIITSNDFSDGSFLPEQFTCDGEGISPSISVKALPSETKSITLIIEDPDAPGGIYDHWIVYNISPDTQIDEDSVPGIELLNSSGRKEYKAPCPPSGTHHYIFKVFALDAMLNLNGDAGKRTLLKAMEGHILAKGELTTLYKRKSK